MTIFLPLEEEKPPPSTPSFLLQVQHEQRQAQLAKVVQAIMKAKRVVVICGAGISVQAGIPDFRSQEGLFKTLKRDNPKEALSSGKDLFDASVFHTESKTALFCQMMAQLADLSQSAEPTSFHHFLRALNDRGRLLRVYTQNIDAIEEKCGLSLGVPLFDDKKSASRGRPSKGKSEGAQTVDQADVPSMHHLPSPSSSSTSAQETPRCIPLHGTLQQMHCQICRNSFPLQDYLPSLSAGQPPECPSCTTLEEARAILGKRARGIGKLRPSVVLYNEAHHDGEGVGDVVQKDLMGSKGKGNSGADLLLVVGTSLKVPGTKRMVREFAKAVRTRGAGAFVKEKDKEKEASSASGPSSASGSSRQTPVSDEEEKRSAPIKAVYLNLEFPAPTREWEGVFDAWVQGDAQVFADMLQAEFVKEAKVKEQILEKRRRKEEESALHAHDQDVEMRCPPTPPTPKRKATSKAKVKADSSPTKKLKTSKPKPKARASLPTPASSSSSSPTRTPRTPPRPSTSSQSHSYLPTPETTPKSQRDRPFDGVYSSDEDSDTAPPLDGPISTFLATSVRARFAQLRTPPTPHHIYKTSQRRLSFGHTRDPGRGIVTTATTSSIRSTLLDHERDGGPLCA
ncbi:DHS-like NAD/FAD-binding domain-containing protein [Coprinopsis sp. MPI-PUGE-AT-0042]|nr:DHS-like NAD/FAD-binding domain-containing protein [Coprinopsis sp. MPI-PUGE-AT-0042]